MPHRKPLDNAPGRAGQDMVQGAVVRRGDQVATQTTDQKLLEDDATDWQRDDPWRVMRIQSEFVDGFDTLAELGPAISIFGSARTQPDSRHWQAAEELGRRLAEGGWTVVTGGGPGVMAAANKGAHEAGGVSVGLGIELPFETALNEWVNLGINFRYFFVRKVMFLKYAQGFIAMPGGFGTFDEFFEALTLAQTGKMRHFPVVLFGVDYWSGLVDWLREQCLAAGYIHPDDLDMFLLTDDVAEAVAHVTTPVPDEMGR